MCAPLCLLYYDNVLKKMFPLGIQIWPNKAGRSAAETQMWISDGSLDWYVTWSHQPIPHTHTHTQIQIQTHTTTDTTHPTAYTYIHHILHRLMAKIWTNGMDGGYMELVSHLFECHMVAEIFITSAFRNLGELHPVLQVCCVYVWDIYIYICYKGRVCVWCM